MKRWIGVLAIAVGLTVGARLSAQVPQIISFQGRVAVGGVNFTGTGQFKFALLNAAGATTYWSNDGTSTAGSQPSAPVTLPVSNGLYSVLLGDTNLANMTGVPSSVFGNADVRLRVWFNDGSHGFQQLSPDQRVAAVGYAMVAATVPDGSLTSAKFVPGSVTPNLLSQEYAVFEERAPNGEDGPSLSAGWNTRAIDTMASHAGASISKGAGHAVVLAPGTYLVEADCSSYGGGRNRAALFDVTNASSPVAVVLGSCDIGVITNASGEPVTHSLTLGYFTVIGGSHSFELRHYFQSAVEGARVPASGSGLEEVYARARFVRVQ